MVEHAVQNHSHSPCFRLGAEGAEILLRAQHGVDLCIIRCVIAVIGGGFKNGAQVQGGHAHIPQLVQLAGDACQLAAEKVPVAGLAVGVRPPLGNVFPTFLNIAVSDETVGLRERQAAEAVWKYLVSYAGAEPLRRVAFPVHGQLPGLQSAVAAVAGPVQVTAGTVLPPQAEVVPHQLRLRGSRKRQGKKGPLLLRAHAGQLVDLLLTGKLPPQHQGTVGKGLDGQGAAAEGDGGGAGDGTEGVFAQDTAGVVYKGFAHRKTAPYCIS